MTEGSGYGPYAYSDSPAGPGGYGAPGGYGGYGYPPPPPPRRRGSGILSHLAVAVLAGAVGVGATLAFDQPGSGLSASGGTQLPGAGAVPNPGSGSGGSGAGGSASEQSVVNKVTPGMVIINTQLQYNSEAAAGSGMVINKNGLVLTNNHVIEGATKLSATVVGTGKTYPATVVGYDKTKDIALIKLTGAPSLKTVPLGNSSTVKKGDPAVALGNAQGQGSVVPAAGQITGLNQSITASDQGGSVASEKLTGMLETSANVVSGDSGGPLANASGQVIGMDTAGDSVNIGSQAPSTGSGFAIPINTALSVAKQIAAGQASPTIQIGYPPFIGVYIAQGNAVSPQQQAQEQQQQGQGNPFGGPGGGEGGGTGPAPSCYNNNSDLQIPQQVAPVNSGTLIDGVICNSPAASAGMTGGAVITSVNGQQAGPPTHLSGILAKLKPGDTASITWVSPQGKQTTSKLNLVAGPPQ